MKPLVIAHRGAAGHAPESTKTAFQKALSMNPDAIEFDIQLAKDNVFVVFHDYMLKRTTGSRGNVKDFTLAQLKRLDCGSWFGRQFAGEKILTLGEALGIIGNRLPIFIDLKDKHFNKPEEAVAMFAGILRKHKITQTLSVAGEFHVADPFIAALSQKMPNVELRYFCNREPDCLKKISNAYKSVGPHFIMAKKKFCQLAHRQGLKVYAWTPNTRAVMKKLIKNGADGLFVNYPDRMQEVINGLNKSSSKRH